MSNRQPSTFADLPSPARTADEFVADLRQLRARAGHPSFRKLSRIADQRIADAPPDARPDPLPPSTTSEVLAGKRLPRLPRVEFVESYVAACLRSGLADEPEIAAEVARWRAAWCALAESSPAEPSSADSGRTEPPAADTRTPSRRALTLPLVAAVFVAGVGTGVAGTHGWAAWRKPATAAAPEPSPEARDDCQPPGAADPTGRDVLGLPPAGQTTGSWWVSNSHVATFGNEGHQFKVDITARTAAPGDVVIVKSDVDLVEGHSYALAFTALANSVTTIRVRAQDRPPTYQESYTRDLPVNGTACRHVYRFVAAKTSPHSELTFQVGGHDAGFRVQIADVLLVADPA